MSALRIHHDCVDHPWIAFPFEPRALWPTSNIEALPVLDHQTFIAMDLGALNTQTGQIRPVFEGQDFGQVQPVAFMPAHPSLKSLAT